jgi:hypothetical protein
MSPIFGGSSDEIEAMAGSLTESVEAAAAN